MIRLYEVRLPLGFTQETLRQACAQRLGLSPDRVQAALVRRGIDARRGRPVCWTCTADVTVSGTPEGRLLRRAGKASVVQPYHYQFPSRYPLDQRPVVVGAGPAGLFCALSLARAGARPLLLERGGDIDSRRQAVEVFWQGGPFSPVTNVQFGEGGAGAFSDGKLTTGIKDPRVRQVLLELYRAGAPEEILIDALPHIGTDQLRLVVRRLRQELVELGAEIRFYSLVTDLLLRQGRVAGVMLESGEELPAGAVVLAPGHSARDTFSLLRRRGAAMARKPFAMGVRIEHRQEWVSQTQYGPAAGQLPPAPYKLSVRLADGRGVYTFCMCPGGVVVAAASEPETVVTNGMSNLARDGENANSALLAGIAPEDLPGDDVFAGLILQRQLEQAAFRLAGGTYQAPAQRVEDFLLGRASRGFGMVTPSYRPGVIPADLGRLLPDPLTQALRQGLTALDRRLPGFAQPDAVLTGPETRSSSPVRLLRGQDYQSVTLPGLYPCGEGAGYAGGIVSAAVDGLRVAEALCRQD